jgi:hypothetical protein
MYVCMYVCMGILRHFWRRSAWLWALFCFDVIVCMYVLICLRLACAEIRYQIFLRVFVCFDCAQEAWWTKISIMEKKFCCICVYACTIYECVYVCRYACVWLSAWQWA